MYSLESSPKVPFLLELILLFVCSRSLPVSGANPAKMSLTNCRFYEEKYPEVDSYVMVNVKQVCSEEATV